MTGIYNFRHLFFSILLANLLIAGSGLSAHLPASALEKPESKQLARTTTAKHRFDFRLEGASCATCLLKIRAAVRKTKGVVSCEMALRKPYGGVIIYNAGDIDVKKLSAIMVKADPRSTVVVKDQVDESIEKVPVLLIPKYNSLLQKAN